MQDTIVAIATPEGTGALGIIRISGPESWDIIKKATEYSSDFTPRKTLLLRFFDSDKRLLDRAVVTAYRAPKSYTGEDLVEITCHGGQEVLRAVLNRLLSLGARTAEPGEFSKRAFINGKMSLDQAEAVVHLIEARTQTAVRAAARLMDGGLKGRLGLLRQKLLEMLTLVELGLDFIEEGHELETKEVTGEKVSSVLNEVDSLLKQYRAGRFIRDGALIVIGGEPNSGKSTLLNHLIGYDRAIVSETPGTTRDYIDVTQDWHGIPVRVYDTAGLRDTTDQIESEGTRRSHELFEIADIVVWLMSPPGFIPPPDKLTGRDHLFTVINKSDLLSMINIEEDITSTGFTETIKCRISAKFSDGIEDLRSQITEHLLMGYDPNDLLLVEGRHSDLLQEAKEALQSAKEALSRNSGLELVATDLHIALNSVGEITGAVSSQDLLNEIFSRFCVGK
ncbi:MAG: tRNA uridine-5-carboxymethylaminomethyl(34) synthesis GTPase MnmE [Candidatus Electryonea clarkiae]|nr:tRNA uridine-5-carboxymethylaminomethyl(34) synthesis GTPase MnmE [Candidatus Electryonea clarkiae]MDP8288959.1 tRNA uridine-5-carboxymethylaminomethyl(34) synthesis GTPase MnmE [Candidatus Electryonea clarkiae]